MRTGLDTDGRNVSPLSEAGTRQEETSPEKPASKENVPKAVTKRPEASAAPTQAADKAMEQEKRT